MQASGASPCLAVIGAQSRCSSAHVSFLSAKMTQFSWPRRRSWSTQLYVQPDMREFEVNRMISPLCPRARATDAAMPGASMSTPVVSSGSMRCEARGYGI